MSDKEIPVGRELDATVARQVFGGPEAHPDWWAWACDRQEDGAYWYRVGIYWGPRFSTEIAYAWGVVERMEELGFAWLLAKAVTKEPQYEVHFYQMEAFGAPVSASGLVHAPDLCGDICAAALDACANLKRAQDRKSLSMRPLAEGAD